MRVLNVRPKGVYIDIEFSMEQLQYILAFLDHSECKFNSEIEPEMRQANDYVVNVLYPDIRDLLKEIKHGT